jgi:hypothetical protein
VLFHFCALHAVPNCPQVSQNARHLTDRPTDMLLSVAWPNVTPPLSTPCFTTQLNTVQLHIPSACTVSLHSTGESREIKLFHLSLRHFSLSAQLDVSGETLSSWIGLRPAADFRHVRHIEDEQVLVLNCILDLLWAGRGSWVGSVGYLWFLELNKLWSVGLESRLGVALYPQGKTIETSTSLIAK